MAARHWAATETLGYEGVLGMSVSKKGRAAMGFRPTPEGVLAVTLQVSAQAVKRLQIFFGRLADGWTVV